MLVAGGAAGELFVVLGGYVLLFLAQARSRALLRAIDAGDRPNDGRGFASFAWMLSMVGSAFAILAFMRVVLG